MPLTLDGTNGVSAVQAGAVESGDLPAGSVIQVVQGTASSQVQSTSSALVNTGLDASITPVSLTSKILCVVTHPNCDKRNGNGYMNMILNRGTTEIYQPNTQFGFTNDSSTISFGVCFSFLDSPNTISSVNYKTRFSNGGSDGTIGVQNNGNVSTMVLMEIAG